MNLKNSIGLLTILAAASMIFVAFNLISQGVNISANTVKYAIFNLVFLVAIAGAYLLTQHCQIKPLTKKISLIFALALSVFGALTAYNIIPIEKLWHVLISISVAYITIVQMNLLRWDKSKSILKILGLLTFVSNLFIIAFYFFKINHATAGMILDITIVSSTFSFLFGLVISKQKKQANT